ncbi:hypothetical protein C4556_02085 [Candidatus Parcubacteria bacterium]|nr:MAG: hypothetical protein C4556_02085 [Candidatus Parcubacteria bacterium]
MWRILKFLSRFSRRTRFVATIIGFAANAALTHAMLVYAGATNRPEWGAYAGLIQLLLVLPIVPFIMSLINEKYEAKGVYGMFVKDKVSD